MYAAKDVEKSVSRIEKLAAWANKVSLVLFAVLILSYVSDFGPRYGVIREAAVAQDREETQRPLRKESTDRLRKLTSEAQTALARLQADPKSTAGQRERAANNLRTLQIDYAKAVAKAMKKGYASEARLNALRRLSQQVQFKVFGLEFGAAGPAAPFIWLASFLLGLLNLALARRAILRTAVTCLADIRDGMRAPAWLLRDALGVVPVWAGPIPRRLWRGIDHASMRNAVSFRFASDWMSFLTLGLGLVCLWFSTRIMRFCLLLPSIMYNFPNGSTRAAVFALALFIAAAIVILISWFWPVIRVPDDATDRLPNLIGRRDLLFGAAGFLGTVFSSSFLLDHLRASLRNPRRRKSISSLVIDSRVPAPRFRRKPLWNPVRMRAGFYEDQQTKVIHYVPEEGRSRSLLEPAGSRWQQIPASRLRALADESLTKAQYGRLHPSAITPWAKHITLLLLNRGDHRQAYEILVQVLQHQRVFRMAGARGAVDFASAPSVATQMPSRKITRLHFQILDLLSHVASHAQNREYAATLVSCAHGITLDERVAPDSFASRAGAASDAESAAALTVPRRFSRRRFDALVGRFSQLESIQAQRKKTIAEMNRFPKSKWTARDRLMNRIQTRLSVWNNPEKLFSDRKARLPSIREGGRPPLAERRRAIPRYRLVF